MISNIMSALSIAGGEFGIPDVSCFVCILDVFMIFIIIQKY
jgi:hypothetical protein